jgi:hypothetical protein
MWLFTRYGFFSVVNARRGNGTADPNLLMIRARRIADLRRLCQRFPALGTYDIATTPHNDYRYRLVAPKVLWTSLIGELAAEQGWSNFKSEAHRFQGAAGADYDAALHHVWDVMYGFQQSEKRFALINRDADGVITNAGDLAAEDVVNEKIWCPACHEKAFAAWPEGWDGHAAFACRVEGETPEERKANYKREYRHLFR